MNKEIAVLVGLVACLYIFKTAFELYSTFGNGKKVNGFVTPIDTKIDKLDDKMGQLNITMTKLVGGIETNNINMVKHIDNQDKLLTELELSRRLREESKH